VSKAKELLNELQSLDLDIQSRIDEINELEAGLLSSPKFKSDKIKGGPTRKIDDVYCQLIVMKEAIEQDTSEIIMRKIELGRMINKLKNPRHRTVLRMTYIIKQDVFDICDKLDISQSSYYSQRKTAIEELDKILE
jgi:DNA-directed RNA polymerase specialized sigma subunit